ncbi:helix-turn-helix domain-containing protein [Sphingobium terrigena]|uniref:AlbA family DNA-binding domain-containing protein n=1 Tax=Sphingobium terrigena TaxID=2304063 RepID=UPI001C71FA61|nr:ATP-binding protein [Sphingobium terrigena]
MAVNAGDIRKTDLSDLVDFPRETLDVELKGWLDLADRVAQAKLAKHIAALANHGGGYLVFGFQDDESVAPTRPVDLSAYNRDAFSAVVKRYLTPTFQCDVSIVSATSGLDYPVVRVPSHGAAPIAAKADGPADDKGRPQGIVSGAHYIRKTGPESAPAQNAEDWQPLIRRCVLADRDALLSDIARAVQIRIEPERPGTDAVLAAWHDASANRWAAIVANAPTFDWPVDISANHCQLSYMILADDGVELPAGELRRTLEDANRDVRQTVWTGWSMFYPFTRPEIAAALHPEHDDGSGVEVLESNLIGDGSFETSLPDFWRFAADGRATLLRPYREDRRSGISFSGRTSGTWLSPETVLRETAELVAHARIMAERAGGTSVAFRCTWKGLSGRMIDDFGNIYWSPGRVARADQRTTSGTWDVPAIVANWHAVVASLACPVLNLFNFEGCGEQLVAGLAPRFVKLSS